MNSIKKEDTKFILYPYPFNYLDNNNEEKNVTNGGFFSLNDSLLNGGKFKYLQNISSVQIGKAKGIYDIDIAIMSLNYVYKGKETDLFTEAGLFCDYFVNQLNKLSSCLDGKNEYLEYKSYYPNKGAVVRVSEKDILNETLFDSESGQLKFKLLIFSDYLTGNEETILNEYINQEEREIIKQFRDLGGHIITSGKSGYLLELMGLLPQGTYDNSITIHTKNKESTNPIYGCENIYKNSPDEQNDYLKELICLGYKKRTYLSQAFPMKNIPSDFESLIEYTNEETNLLYKKDGYQFDIKDKNVKYHYILISKEEKGKGRIMLVNGSPIKDMYYFDNVRNMILYAMSKNVIYDLKIKFNPSNPNIDEDLPIPAGEEGVQLVALYKLYNFADYDMTSVEINILIANKVDIISNVEGCEIIQDNKYKGLNISYINSSKYLKCYIEKLDKLSSYNNSFLVEIKDYSVTQKLYDIPLMYSNISYKDNEFEKEVITTPGIYYVQAALAGLLRATINKDPTSTYPLEGYGKYFDLVLSVENKEATEAKDVNYISLIPLVTPLFDGEDEGSVAKIIPLYENYYEDHEFNYPWTDINNRGVDYIDYAEVAGKGVCYVSDYDTPVQLSKVQRDQLSDQITNLYIPKGKVTVDDYAGQDKATNPNSLLKQIYFGDNEKFYETATARTSLFINTATEEGAKAMYNGSIDNDLVDPYNNKRTKVQYAFIRVDTYFYNSINEQYQLPDGFDNSILISIDKFNQSRLGEPKGEVLGDRKPTILNPGHYDSSKERYNRLKPNEYSNSLREYKFMKQYDPTDSEQIKELQNKTNSTIYLSHFMIPFSDKIGISRAGSILGFKENEDNGDGSGYLESYPSVKFVYAHSIDVLIDPAITRLGGAVEIILDENIKFKDLDPIKEERITISADNVAFYKTKYDKENNKIILYFKRGLMPNENYGQISKCKVFLENLNINTNFDISLNIYNLKYDFSSENLESLIIVEEAKIITAIYKPFFSLPCLYMENKLTRKNSFSEEDSHALYEYELMNPYTRYGGYYQELTKHTSVYASAEAHHVKRPGFQSASSGFSLLANLGTSSIPFADYLEHGKLSIPGVVSTSRIEWSDIWGRKWSQNLRSVYPDIPVLPPVPLSFIMTTTYELITNDEKQERVLEWQSDESVYIRIQMKVRNTYKLYWEPTICHANQLSFIKQSYIDYKNPLFVDFDKLENINNYGDNYDVNLGFSPQYGVCYDTNSYLNGIKVNETILEDIKEMTSCSDILDAEEMTKCSKDFDAKYKNKGYPIVKKRPEEITDEKDKTPNKNWNYSPLIESYLPEGYINTNQMWQLSISDYYDDSFYKGYPFHLDDCIPNLDNPINKPHDLIAFPIYKGLGYNISYSKDYSLKKFKQYKGWWSDQLQNKDHTLLAGQQKVNQVSVGKESLLKDSDWINAKDLINTKEANLPKNRLKNIYVCQYNQNRVKIKPGQTKYAFLKNVYQNNVVPVLPDLSENSDSYTNFDCSGENSYQYTPYNISKVDNRVYTGNDRDWLYFAVGLRSNARENINVILKMDPIEGNKYEGITKVQDGGRFTYWQPPDGPNSYQYYDCNINTVISKRVDLSMTHRMIPTNLYTFNSFSYQLFSIADKKEKDREYTMNTYMNSHGYGDATITVYVGGTDNTKCKVNPGEYTYVKIVFYNNAGFDWKMKEKAITMNYEGYSLALNANSIMTGKVTAIQYPKEYNFMSYIIPDEIKSYVTLTPSQHNLDISPQFYDLTFNNVLNIKDGLEGNYFYCLNISKTFPEKYKGKLWEIKIKLNEQYFESLPGVNDITNIHNYHLTIPSIRFGVPISSGPYAGKIFYNLGQATNLIFTYKIYKEFDFQDIKIINEEKANELSVAISNNDDKFNKLMEVWDSIKISPEISSKIKVTEGDYTSKDFYKLITVDLTEAYPLFPYEIEMNPYATNISILIQSYASHIPFGYRNLLGDTKITYNDSRKIKQNDVDYPLYINCYASGPHITTEVTHDLVEFDISTSTFSPVDGEIIYNGDKKYVKLSLYSINEGTETAFNTQFELDIDAKAIYIPSKDTSDSITCFDLGIVGDARKVIVFYEGKIYAGDVLRFDIFFEKEFGEKKEPEYNEDDLFDLEDRRNLEEKSNKEIFLKKLDISLCLADIKCEEGDANYGKQKTDITHEISYKEQQRAVGRIFLNVENIGTDLMPKYILSTSISNVKKNYNISTVQYSFKRKIEGTDERFIDIALTYNNTITDIPFKEGEINEKKRYTITYKVIGEFPNGRTLDSLNKNEVTLTYILENNVEKETNNGIPFYFIIIIIIVAGLAIILLGGFLIYKFCCKKKKYVNENSEVTSVKQRSKFEDISLKPQSSSRNLNPRNKIIKFQENKII